MKLSLLCKYAAVILVARLKLSLELLLLVDQIDDSTAVSALVKKCLHLVGHLCRRALIIDALAAREEYILNRLLDRALVYGRVTDLTDEGGVIEELSVYSEEYVACGKLTECGAAGLEIDDGSLLLIGRARRIIGRNGGTGDKVSLILDPYVHRALRHPGSPVYPLLPLGTRTHRYGFV